MQGQTGSYVTTKLVTAPASGALTTLANVKDELDITVTDEDTRLTRFITEESAGIARYCSRIFGLATWQDQFRLSRGVWGEGVRQANNPLKLTRWPLAIMPVVFTGNTHSNLLVDGVASTVGLVQGQPVFGAGIASGATIASVQPSSVMLSVAATATASAAQLTAGMSVVETLCGVDTPLVLGTDYEVDTGSLLPGDEGAACLYRLNENGRPCTWHGDKVTVIYQAGYALAGASVGTALPSDLETACIQMVVTRYRTRGRDPTVIERSQGQMVGTERYWVGTPPGQKGAFPPEIEALIEQYRVPVIA